MKLIFENWRKHLSEDLNSSNMIDKLKRKLKELTGGEDLQGRGANMYIEDIAEPGESPKVRAVQTNSEEEVVAQSVWTDFPAFLDLFKALIGSDRPDLIMYELEDKARNHPGGYVP